MALSELQIPQQDSSSFPCRLSNPHSSCLANDHFQDPSALALLLSPMIKYNFFVSNEFLFLPFVPCSQTSPRFQPRLVSFHFGYFYQRWQNAAQGCPLQRGLILPLPAGQSRLPLRWK